MASCLQLPMASSYSLISSLTSSKNRVSSIESRFVVNCHSKYFSELPIPTNPNDPFLKKLASVASTNPESLLERPQGPDTLPLLDVLGYPTLMATPIKYDRPDSYNSHSDRPGRKRRNPPPDLPSLLLDGRIVYIGLPLVPAVTELVVAELIYLNWHSPNEPIFVYINSTGTTRDDGETVGLETEGFAIYDTMMLMKAEKYTLGMGAAVGQACLLLSAGTKGKRFMMPNAQAMIHEPKVPATGLMQASDVAIRTKEVVANRDTLVKLLAKHTGNSEEAVSNIIRRGPFHMDAIQAKEFGVIDRILWRGQEKMMKAVAAPEDWDEGPGIKAS